MRSLALAEVGGVSGGYWVDDGYGNTEWYGDTDKRTWDYGGGGGTSPTGGANPYTFASVWVGPIQGTAVNAAGQQFLSLGFNVGVGMPTGLSTGGGFYGGSVTDVFTGPSWNANIGGAGISGNIGSDMSPNAVQTGLGAWNMGVGVSIGVTLNGHNYSQDPNYAVPEGGGTVSPEWGIGSPAGVGVGFSGDDDDSEDDEEYEDSGGTGSGVVSWGVMPPQNRDAVTHN
jgi:hypothetical protein